MKPHPAMHPKQPTKQRILVGVTKEHELYFLDIEQPTKEHDYFAMSGFTVRPIKQEDAVQWVRDNLEDGELWKQAVEADRTTLGLDDWIEYVLETDGPLTGFDNSLFPYELTIDGIRYLYESGSCGQHEEKAEDIVHWCIPQSTFDTLMALWKKYHLEKKTVTLPALREQNVEAEAAECVRWIVENA